MLDDDVQRLISEVPATREAVLERVVAARLETESKATVARLRDGGARVLQTSAAELAENLVDALATSKVLKQLETLEISMGTLSAAGARVFTEHAAAFKHLKQVTSRPRQSQTSDSHSRRRGGCR